MESSDFSEAKDGIRKNAECIEEKEREVLRETKKRKWKLVLSALVSLFLFAIFAFLVGFGGAYFRRSENGGVVDKEAIKVSLRFAIKNGGDLNVLKHIYSRRQDENPLVILPRDRNKYYPYETAFSLVLEDLRGDYFSSNRFERDSLYLNRLESIILENNNRNPFDQLEESQRYYFNNVITKSAETYSKIQEDINNIANELQEKNLLVSRYLRRSSGSFYLSIAALVITFLATLWQLIRARKPERNEKQDLMSDEDEDGSNRDIDYKVSLKR